VPESIRTLANAIADERCACVTGLGAFEDPDRNRNFFAELACHLSDEAQRRNDAVRDWHIHDDPFYAAQKHYIAAEDIDLTLSTIQQFVLAQHEWAIDLPVIRHIARLPFSLYIHFGWDELLLQAIKKHRPGAKPELHWPSDEKPIGTLSPDRPVVFNLFGRMPLREGPRLNHVWVTEDSLYDQGPVIDCLNGDLPGAVKRFVQDGGNRFLVVGMGLHKWYNRLALRLFRSTQNRQGVSPTFEPHIFFRDAEDSTSVRFITRRSIKWDISELDVRTLEAALAQIQPPARHPEFPGRASAAAADRPIEVFISYKAQTATKPRLSRPS
jgi:hypothetical protein